MDFLELVRLLVARVDLHILYLGWHLGSLFVLLHKVFGLALALGILDTFKQLSSEFLGHLLGLVALLQTLELMLEQLKGLFDLVRAVLEDDEGLFVSILLLNVMEADEVADLGVDVLFSKLKLHQ